MVEEWLMKRFEGVVVKVQREKKWDLNLVSVDSPLLPKGRRLMHSRIISSQPLPYT